MSVIGLNISAPRTRGDLADCSPTFPFHVNDPVGAEPLTVDFLLQVKHSPPINLLIGDAVIVVSSPCTGPLNREKSV